MRGTRGLAVAGGKGTLVRQRHQLFVSLLVLMDALVIAAASYSAWGLRRAVIEGFPPNSWETWFKEPLVLFSIPVTLVCLRAMGLYRPRRDRSIWSEQGQVIKASLLATGVMILVLWLVGNDLVDTQGDYGPATVGPFVLDAARVQFLGLAALMPVLLGVERLAFRVALRRLRQRGWNLRHVCVVGVGRLGQIAARTISRNGWTGMHIDFFISHHDETQRKSCLSRPVLGGLNDLESVLDEHKVDAVYLALPSSRAGETARLLKRLDRYPCDVRIIPDVPPRYLAQTMSVNELDGMPILSYRECPLYGLGGFTKRVVDVAGGVAALILFAPVMLLVGLLVAISGPGPVIFRQKRVSLGGEEFEIYKFRTMRHAAEEAGGPHWTKRDDPRITPLGQWLRRTSLDELPQLFNVLKGEMSLVGPRPERPELIARFRDDWRGYMLRQHVKAGMTGWAQVQGLRGSTSLRKRLQHDRYYIRHWSLRLDLKILWLTLFRGFVHRNAH
ncbi:MAG: undecaprenyl-phosphate glucose phosphotransferase [Planctomycetota bacterium]